MATAQVERLNPILERERSRAGHSSALTAEKEVGLAVVGVMHSNRIN